MIYIKLLLFFSWQNTWLILLTQIKEENTHVSEGAKLSLDVYRGFMIFKQDFHLLSFLCVAGMP